tara:strand:- start:874 stop:1224 length:351 start_codon:yes stop_codon:yes gene_type:complete
MAGRKKININWQRVDKALEAGANGVQCAAMLGVHPDTLYNKCKEAHKMDFSAYQQIKREAGNEKLLAAQYNLAIKENDRSMLIWLGKQRLNQAEKREVKNEFNGLNFKIVEDADGD